MADKKHLWKFYKCSTCWYRSKSNFLMLTHEKQHKSTSQSDTFTCSSTPENYGCEFCKLETNLRINLFCHHSVFHKSKAACFSRRFLKVCHYQCKKCPFETYSLLLLTKHEYSIHRIHYLTLCSEIVIDNARWFQCEQCEFKTRHNYSIKTHILSKHCAREAVNLSPRNQWFPCDQCPYKSKIKRDLNRHISAKHVDPKYRVWLQCEQCAYRATEKFNLKTHILVKHAPPEEVNWFECDQCSYKTKLKSVLLQHVSTRHSDWKHKVWFECEHCPFKAKIKSNLKTHVQRKHTPENINWLKCEQCSYKVRQKFRLEQHILKKHKSITASLVQM